MSLFSDSLCPICCFSPHCIMLDVTGRCISGSFIYIFVWLINYSNRCACLCKSVYLRSHEIQSRPLHKCIITHTHTHTLTLSGTAMILPASLSAPRSLMALLLSRVLTPFFLSISPLIEYKNSCRCGFLPTERVDWNAVILIMCL